MSTNQTWRDRGLGDTSGWAKPTLSPEISAQLADIPNKTYITNKAKQTSLDMTTKQSRRFKKDRLSDNLPKNYRFYSFPVAFNFANIPINVYSDGESFFTDYNKENFKNTGGTTYHVTTAGLAANDGLTEATATTLNQAYSKAVNGDTILIHEGDYQRVNLDWSGSFAVSKSINIIGAGNVRFFAGDFKSFTKTAAYNFVYETANTITLKVLDTSFSVYGYAYKKVNSLAECDAQKGSWYYDGTKVYVHTLKNDDPTGYVVSLFSGVTWFNLNNTGATAALKIYMENIKIYGGEFYNLTVKKDNANFGIAVTLDNVWGLHTAGQFSAFRNQGGNTVFYQCKALFSEKDGFSYTTATSTGIEIDCIGAHNGLNNADPAADGTHNGSTAHDGSKIIRINGEYFNNFGANVGDVHVGTQSVNLACRAYNCATKYKDYRDTDFTAQQAGTTMWLDSCDSWGSMFNIQAVADTTIYIRNATYDLLGGLGSIVNY